MPSNQPGPDAEGLQAVENNNYPEVVPGSNSPYVPGSKSPYERRSSLTSPEVYHHPVPAQDVKQPAHSPYGEAPSATGGYLPNGAQSPAPPSYNQNNQLLESQEKSARKSERRLCGMRRKVALWVIALIVAIIVIAAVLGGALGATLSNHGSSNDDNNSNNGNSNSNDGSGSGSGSGSQNDNSAGNAGYTAQDKTGVALLHPPGSSSVYMYYMSEGNQIVEAEYLNGYWQQDRNLPKAKTNITNDAADGSPIAAISYTLQGNTQYRQIFFIGSNGLVATSNTTGDAAWSSPYNPVMDLKPSSTTKSLAAVADTSSNALYGIRVYFGSQAGYIQEIGMDFGEAEPPYWHSDWSYFPGSDPEGGVASVLMHNNNHLYLRNSTSSLLQQWTWNYITKDGWQIGANASTSNQVAENAAIAAATDGQNTDYIFYQQSGGQTVKALYSGGSFSDISAQGMSNLKQAPVGYNLASTWANAGAVILNQNSSDSTELLFSSVSSNGQSSEYTTNTGTSS